MFNQAVDSKLRGFDQVALKVGDITQGNQVSPRAIVMHHKKQRPMQFDITQPTQDAVSSGCPNPG